MNAIRVVDYAPRWQPDFARLNLEWVERYFTVEKVDEEVLGDPDTHVLKNGGLILMAVTEDDIAVGTAALKHHGAGVYELTKMAVAPEHRGEGIGRLLINAALDRYRALNGNRLFLESNRKLATALRLYETSGFRHRPAPPSPYARADVYMEWDHDEAAPVMREIVGFHRDDVGDWVADLSCGHSVHVRHKPPWQERAWVMDDAERDARIGTQLECVRCERGEPAD